MTAPEPGAPVERTATRHVASVRAGNIRLARATCELYFPGIQNVALIEREGQFLIVPLIAQSAGGSLLKIRNAQGDRVIHAQEFFRDHGYLEDSQEREISLEWNPEWAALVLRDLPRAAGAL